jgi:hypothetical protein
MNIPLEVTGTGENCACSMGASASRELILWELEFMEQPIGIEPTPEPWHV